MDYLNLVLLIINILILVGGYPITIFNEFSKMRRKTQDLKHEIDNLREIIFDKHIL